MSTGVQRGMARLLQRIQHTADIYGFFASLAQAARQESELALCWWETGAVCERRYRLQEQWYNLRPDALAEYRVRQQRTRCWLEWDRGTMNVRDLAVKFTSYASSIASREWARERIEAASARLCRAGHRAGEAHATGGSGQTHVSSWIGGVDDHGGALERTRAIAPIWLQNKPQSSQAAQSGSALRQCLFDVIPGRSRSVCRNTLS